jgi:hypothetical protein
MPMETKPSNAEAIASMRRLLAGKADISRFWPNLFLDVSLIPLTGCIGVNRLATFSFLPAALQGRVAAAGDHGRFIQIPRPVASALSCEAREIRVTRVG